MNLRPTLNPNQNNRNKMKRVFLNPTYIFLSLGIGVLIFDIGYLTMANLPGERNFACVEGAYLTPFNLIYMAVFGLLSGLFISGFLELYKLKAAKNQSKLVSLSGIGFVFVGLTTFCTACTLPVISVFGFSIGLSLFTTYNIYFKLAALVSMLAALFLLNRRINEKCGC